MADKEIISIDLSSDSEPECAPEQTDSQISQNTPLPTKPSLPGRPKQDPKNKGDKHLRAMKNLTLGNATFMAKFDPEKSNREKRKLSKKFTTDNQRTGHDEVGVILGTGMDLCDCLIESCPGCFFPCRNCRSCKCGVDCRNNRKWLIESVENEADNKINRNPYYIQQQSKT